MSTILPTQTIQVIVRPRPLSGNIGHNTNSNNGDTTAVSLGTTTDELNIDGGSIVKIDEDKSIVSIMRDKKGLTLTDFQFTKVFPANSHQKSIYDVCNVTHDVLDGINCCIMAYGQTGSGKTHTMYGVNWEQDTTASTVITSS